MKKELFETIGVNTRANATFIQSGLTKNRVNAMRYLASSFGLLLFFASAANAQQPPVLDHFNCYLTPGQPLIPQTAFLSDQFTVRDKVSDITSDIRMVLFCPPVKKTVIGSTVIPPVPIIHPDAHLAIYLTSPIGSSIPRSVTINNQFGTQTLVTGAAELLAVPTGKTPIPVNGGPVTLPAIPPEKELDHFRCYVASGANINKRVLLNDQFFVTTPEVATVLTPRFFCNPVDKAVLPPTGCPTGHVCALQTYPINHPTQHMVCYLMSVATPFQTVVAYNNQFVAPGTLPTAKLTSPAILCVPSTKSENWFDIPAGSLAP